MLRSTYSGVQEDSTSGSAQDTYYALARLIIRGFHRKSGRKTSGISIYLSEEERKRKHHD